MKLELGAAIRAGHRTGTQRGGATDSGRGLRMAADRSSAVQIVLD